ncbi:hypothetical protein GH984_02600 [Spiribacter sp. C176]|uniref:Peptidase S74 domain-containing protein n=1 Tax=Spiribacter salilacus TaxID=2664894 RepID=A0A6N7QPG7_9GAMM|nr:hypothetical protein [Spiribacter salilacus]MRH77590.1 hypothetical protein [Spiribacter salilacus]
MSDTTLPEHLEKLIDALQTNPALGEGVIAAVGDHEGTAAAEAAASYYNKAGYPVTAEELIALEIARKNAVGDALSDAELDLVAGGGSNFFSNLPRNLWATGKLATSLVSDRRLKVSITEAGRDARTGLMQYEFAYRSHPSRRFRGVMADEVAEVMPEAVMVMPSGYHAVDYGRLGLEMTEVDHHV